MRRQAWRSCAGKKAGEGEKREIGELMAQGCTGMGDHEGKNKKEGRWSLVYAPVSEG